MKPEEKIQTLATENKLTTLQVERIYRQAIEDAARVAEANNRVDKGFGGGCDCAEDIKALLPGREERKP